MLFSSFFPQGIQHPLPPPVALDVEVPAKRKTKKIIGLRERHLTFYQSSPMVGRAATVGACSPEYFVTSGVESAQIELSTSYC